MLRGGLKLPSHLFSLPLLNTRSGANILESPGTREITRDSMTSRPLLPSASLGQFCWDAQLRNLRGQPQGESLVPRDGWIDVPLTHSASASLILGE
jgi:hypothetical protein